MFDKLVSPVSLLPKFAFIATECRPTVANRAVVSRIFFGYKYPEKQVLNSFKGFTLLKELLSALLN